MIGPVGWIADVTGARFVRVVGSLTHGVASRVDLVDADGRLLVLRRYDGMLETAEAGALVAHEARVLPEGRAALGPIVPDLVAADPSGDAAGSPALLMTHRPGNPVIGGIDPLALAEPIARLHATVAPEDMAPVWNHPAPRTVPTPEWTRRPATWTVLDELLRDAAPAAPDAFLHRDFHPGNLLWEDGELSGIVDWPYAGRGPRGIDIAHTRANLALTDGMDAADAFLAAYVLLAPDYRHDPWWDAADLAGFANDFRGVLAFNAFGARLDEALLRVRADAFAHAIAAVL